MNVRSIKRCGKLLGVLALWLAHPMPLRAQTATAPHVPEIRLTFEQARDKTAALLVKSCATCHMTSAASAPGGLTGTRLDLDELPHNRGLVVAGEPDASVLYHVVLDAHAPLHAHSAKVPRPTADEIEAVRDWIEQMPSAGPNCSGRETVSEDDAVRLGEEWRKLSGPQGGKLKFVSLVHLYNACRSDAEIAAVRDAVSAALGSLAGKTEPTGLDTVGELSLIASFEPDIAGLSPELLEDLATRDPRGAAGGITADWLVYEAHRRKPQPATEAVALDYLKAVDVLTAAAELGQSGEALASRLTGLEGQDGKAARRLLQGRLARAEWLALAGVITGRSKASLETGAAPGAGTEPLRLSLWSDKLSYKTGDLARFTAVATQNCYLTLVGIDKAGLATVLFPNDLDAENFLRAGSSMTVPVEGAKYQLRFKEPGRETVAAICTSPGERPSGIAHNFEKQRFTVLGPWRAFLYSLDERQAEIAKTETRRSRNGNGGTANENAGPAQEARAAIRITIE